MTNLIVKINRFNQVKNCTQRSIWQLALISSLVLLKSISLLFQNNVTASEILSFGNNDEIQILSDKAYRKSSDNTYEANGNVIIRMGADTIYGEKASVNLLSKIGSVKGNVRYTGPQLNLYGTELSYSFSNSEFQVKNAKLVDDNFIIRGKEILRREDGIFTAKEAEFSTCKDCPESWSVQGQEVKVVPDEYISMTHAFIKINGVIILYIPYIALPIRQERKSGLLFPDLGLDLDDGFYFQQPIFWAINNNSDMTFSPTVYGKRGNGIEVEYRNALGKFTNLTLDTKQISDEIWKPGKLDRDPSGDKELRSSYEANFFYHPNNTFSLLAKSTHFSDLDMQSDYEDYFDRELYMGNEKGTQLASQITGDSFSIDVFSSFMSNSMHDDPEGFDTDFVQNTLSLGLSHKPIMFFNSSGFLSKIGFYENLQFDYFKQDVENENLYYRNIQRLDYSPTLEFVVKPFFNVNLKMTAGLDAQYYYLPTEKEREKAGYKYGNFVKTSFWMDVDKVYGRAYVQEELVKPVLVEDQELNLVTKIPSAKKEEVNTRRLYRSSYKHSVKYGINHFYYNKQKYHGNEDLGNQFALDSDEGRFDERDIIRGNNNTLQDVSTRTDLPESNTVEFVFNNNLLKKTPQKDYSMFKNFNYQLDNFDYTKVSYFNISQGIILDTEDVDLDASERLTRLAVLGGVYVGNFTFGLSEYYFHSESKHITSFSLEHNLDIFLYKISYNYDSFSADRRYFKIDGELLISDIISFRTGHYYDFELERVYESYVGTRVNPSNNCWAFDLEYSQKDQIINNELVKDQSIGIKILVNYNAKNFDSVFGFTL